MRRELSNCQGARDAKKTGGKNKRSRIRGVSRRDSRLLLSYFFLFFVFPWRPWRLGGSLLLLDDRRLFGLEKLGDLGGQDLGVLAVLGAAGDDLHHFAALVDQNVSRHRLAVERLPQLPVGVRQPQE